MLNQYMHNLIIFLFYSFFVEETVSGIRRKDASVKRLISANVAENVQ